MRAGVVADVLLCEDVFACAAELGLHGVEVVLGREGLGRPGALAELAAARERSGLEVPSLILGGHNVDGGIADSDAEVAARASDEVLAALEWSRLVGADVVLVPFFLAADLSDADAVERCATAFAALCPSAERAAVTLCFEGSLAAAKVLELAERIGSPAFGCYFDPANLVVAGLDPTAEALALGRLIRRVHLKDARERRGDCHIGEGRVDFEGCARALDAIGYDGWLVLETPPGQPDEVARDLNFARSAFPALRP
jgi:sugar phosphate isomerase/epimerase